MHQDAWLILGTFTFSWRRCARSARRRRYGLAGQTTAGWRLSNIRHDPKSIHDELYQQHIFIYSK